MNINSTAILIFNWRKSPSQPERIGNGVLCTMLWKTFVIAAETNGEVSLPLPSSQLGRERFLQGLPLLAASMDNEGHGLRAQTILLQMQLHWYAGMETQQPAPALIRFGGLIIMYLSLTPSHSFGQCCTQVEQLEDRKWSREEK